MIETRRLKNVVIFVQTILSFVLSRKIINLYKYFRAFQALFFRATTYVNYQNLEKI